MCFRTSLEGGKAHRWGRGVEEGSRTRPTDGGINSNYHLLGDLLHSKNDVKCAKRVQSLIFKQSRTSSIPGTRSTQQSGHPRERRQCVTSRKIGVVGSVRCSEMLWGMLGNVGRGQGIGGCVTLDWVVS